MPFSDVAQYASPLGSGNRVTPPVQLAIDGFTAPGSEIGNSRLKANAPSRSSRGSFDRPGTVQSWSSSHSGFNTSLVDWAVSLRRRRRNARAHHETGRSRRTLASVVPGRPPATRDGRAAPISYSGWTKRRFFMCTRDPALSGSELEVPAARPRGPSKPSYSTDNVRRCRRARRAWLPGSTALGT